MKKLGSFALSVFLSLSLISCSTSPNSPNNTQQNNTSSNTQNQPNVSSTDLAKIELANLVDEEDVFSDSTDLLNDNTFTTKADGTLLSGKVEVNANTVVDLQKREELQKLLKDNAKQMKDTFSKISKSITVNDDGTIIVDPNKLKEELKTTLETRKEMIKKTLEKVGSKLKELKELTKDKVEKLRRKNNIVRNSEKVSVTNEDGSVTETMTIKFENTKLGITRENTVSKTSKDGKVLSIDHSLKATTSAYTKTVTRLVTYNDDGSKTIKLTSVTEWKNGAKSERNEQRIVKSDKTVTGAGTLTVTSANGETKTYNLNVSVSASGEVTSSATDTSTKEEVQISESSSGQVTQVAKTEAGTTTETTANVEEALTISSNSSSQS